MHMHSGSHSSYARAGRRGHCSRSASHDRYRALAHRHHMHVPRARTRAPPAAELAHDPEGESKLMLTNNMNVIEDRHVHAQASKPLIMSRVGQTDQPCEPTVSHDLPSGSGMRSGARAGANERSSHRYHPIESIQTMRPWKSQTHSVQSIWCRREGVEHCYKVIPNAFATARIFAVAIVALPWAWAAVSTRRITAPRAEQTQWRGISTTCTG
jgi:hypothetical protein